ncbi:hypothetical protein FYJ66_06490 [Clostridiales Family XIII bacterium RF-744-FAT-WT-3]|uniref:Uncharacterized protein n=1 Tax=Baileyella intestinalis TaxID=2606709 RepID=A0A6A8M7A8_9FIRM|nr:hypothetical protein [Baileyella intestinalis]MST69235.1 hypothetical protein [Baileyella intestinalis]
MRKIIKIIISIIVFLLACCFCPCSGRNTAQYAERTGGAESEFPDIESEEEKEMASPDGKETKLKEYYTRKSRIQDVAGDTVFVYAN